MLHPVWKRVEIKESFCCFKQKEDENAATPMDNYVNGLKISKHRVELAPQTRTERDRYDLKFYKLYKR
ncbi:hypothetical protein [Candidatus Paracaedibacter symbiosus]|uniref:hypothetical protein n=1 Tax=Candidatus Paracaedibacter symbiosus TaxID=244582 RepID=UPI000509D5E5|nr:hypothetical protein [Candidatus Paracaedibacter symbiosus]